MSAAQQKDLDVVFLSKKDILSRSGRKIEAFHVPEWDGSVRLGSLTAYHQSLYQSSIMSLEVDDEGDTKTSVNLAGAEIRLAAFGILDENDEQLFSEEELRDANPAAIKRIAKRVKEMSGLDTTLEDAKGN